MDTSDKVRIWEKIIDVQQHFNDVKSKNQTLFVSIITASLIGSGYLFQNKATDAIHLMPFHYFPAKIYTLPILGAVIFTIAFYILDVAIYHNLLKGAVECGKAFEKDELKQRLTSIVIEEHSKNDAIFFDLIKGAECKLKAFYIIIGSALLFLFSAINWFT